MRRVDIASTHRVAAPRRAPSRAMALATATTPTPRAPSRSAPRAASRATARRFAAARRFGGDDSNRRARAAARADGGGDAAADDALDALELLRARGRARASSATTRDDARAARVCLVGVGPGDPGLLTLRAYQLMQTADVVLYDRLVSNEILNLARAEARMVYVGKRAGYHTRTQEEIHELLAAFADAGATILRLKGGDPLVFGRGGEEFEFLREHNPNVRVEVVPGITAAAGVGSELGIPLTHRGVATSVRLLTGHLREGAGSREDATGAASDPVDFAVTSADVETTLVVYMGLGTLPKLSEKLIASGFPADMPAVAIERGTTVDERRVFSSIEHLPEAAAACELVSPTLLIVGRTVTLSPHWPYAADESSYDPKWVEQRGSPRAAEDVDDWRAWLDLDVDFASSRPRAVAREIHVDAF